MKVLVAENIGASGVALLKEHFEVDEGDHLDRIAEYDGILIRSATKLTADVLERATRLKAVAGGTEADRAQHMLMAADIKRFLERPADVAKIIYDAVHDPEPRLRYLAGQDAHTIAGAVKFGSRRPHVPSQVTLITVFQPRSCSTVSRSWA